MIRPGRVALGLPSDLPRSSNCAAASCWVVASAAGGPLALVLLYLFQVPFYSLTAHAGPAVISFAGGLLGAAAGGVAGSLVGLIQVRVLRDRTGPARIWVGATARGWAISGFMASYMTAMLAWQFPALEVLGVAMVIGGAGIGWTQGRLLGNSGHRLIWWVGANVLGASIGWTVARAVLSSLPGASVGDQFGAWGWLLFLAVAHSMVGVTTWIALDITHERLRGLR